MYKYIEMFTFNVRKMKLWRGRVNKVLKTYEMFKPTALLAVSHIVIVTSLPFLKAKLVPGHIDTHRMPWPQQHKQVLQEHYFGTLPGAFLKKPSRFR